MLKYVKVIALYYKKYIHLSHQTIREAQIVEHWTNASIIKFKKMKKKQIKLGDRVNVIEEITETWQSKKCLLNGYVYKIKVYKTHTYITVITDKNSVNDGLNGGVYILGAYIIQTI